MDPVDIAVWVQDAVIELVAVTLGDCEQAPPQETSMRMRWFAVSENKTRPSASTATPEGARTLDSVANTPSSTVSLVHSPPPMPAMVAMTPVTAST